MALHSQDGNYVCYCRSRNSLNTVSERDMDLQEYCRKFSSTGNMGWGKTLSHVIINNCTLTRGAQVFILLKSSVLGAGCDPGTGEQNSI